MLNVETIRKVRKAHFVDGEGIREIARPLKLARTTGRDIIRTGKTDQTYQRSNQSQPKLGLLADRLSALAASRQSTAAARRSSLSNCSGRL